MLITLPPQRSQSPHLGVSKVLMVQSPCFLSDKNPNPSHHTLPPALPARGPQPLVLHGRPAWSSHWAFALAAHHPECPGALPRAYSVIHLPGSLCELLREACRAGLVWSKSPWTSLSPKTATVVFSSWLCYMMVWFWLLSGSLSLSLSVSESRASMYLAGQRAWHLEDCPAPRGPQKCWVSQWMRHWLPPSPCHLQLWGSSLCITLKPLGLWLPVSAMVKHQVSASRDPGKGRDGGRRGVLLRFAHGEKYDLDRDGSHWPSSAVEISRRILLA